MLRHRSLILSLAALVAALYCQLGLAQSAISEDFTGNSTNNPWYSFNGACLTAGGTTTGATLGTAGNIPGCNAIQSYYNENLVGGYNGAAGSAVTLPDPADDGALRFTNGCIPPSSTSTNCSSGGHSQNGIILSGSTFSSSEGVEITFKTVTYRGDSGGNSAGCPSGSTASNGQCVSSTTVAATVTYS
jgi:type IV pilus assembly protein PilY1